VCPYCGGKGYVEQCGLDGICVKVPCPACKGAERDAEQYERYE